LESTDKEFITFQTMFHMRMHMPPLVWRERVVYCPSCWMTVSLEDEFCPICGTGFREHPEVRERKREALAQIRRDVGAVIAIATVILSVSLLIVTLMLDSLHQWIRPIGQDGIPYLAMMTFGLIFALRLYIRNTKGKRESMMIPSLKKLAPYAILVMVCIGAVLLAFAGEVDRLLDSSAYYLLPILAMISVTGMILLAFSINDPRRRRDGYLG